MSDSNSEIEKSGSKRSVELRRAQLKMAKEKLADATSDAIDAMVHITKNGKSDTAKLAAAKAVLEQDAIYSKQDSEMEEAEFDQFLNDNIKHVLKEILRKDVFVRIIELLREEDRATPDKIVAVREDLDAIFGIGTASTEMNDDEIDEAEIVEDN